MSNRREFLKGAAWMAAAAFAAGCQLNRFGFGEGGQMQGCIYRKLMGKRIRVGFIGIGCRGSDAVRRVSKIPGVDIVALCDRKPEQIERTLPGSGSTSTQVLIGSGGMSVTRPTRTSAISGTVTSSIARHRGRFTSRSVSGHF